jgi:hypothetical protein
MPPQTAQPEEKHHSLTMAPKRPDAAAILKKLFIPYTRPRHGIRFEIWQKKENCDLNVELHKFKRSNH